MAAVRYRYRPGVPEDSAAIPNVKVLLPPDGPTLGHRELVATRADGSSDTVALQRTRLLAALSSFERALASPPARAFR